MRARRQVSTFRWRNFTGSYLTRVYAPASQLRACMSKHRGLDPRGPRAHGAHIYAAGLASESSTNTPKRSCVEVHPRVLG